jgi:uncharacterized damage-inducible protein DinB
MIQTIEKPSLTLGSLVKDYANYNAWAVRVMAEWLGSKDADLLEQTVASSFSSIRLTLIHILESQEFWFAAASGGSAVQGTHDIEDTQTILTALVNHAQEFATYVTSLSDEELQQNIHLKTEWFESNRSRFEYLHHAVNHGTYHRGQIVTIGRNLGFTDAPMTDYNFFLLMA